LARTSIRASCSTLDVAARVDYELSSSLGILYEIVFFKKEVKSAPVVPKRHNPNNNFEIMGLFDNKKSKKRGAIRSMCGTGLKTKNAKITIIPR
jgi:hypothetical protein